MNFTKLNNLLGWFCFAAAAITYTLTLEPSVSFWDCGEFIACAARLQVSHQPGYPLFAMLGKVFSLLSFGDKTRIAYFTNFGFALSSSAAIMFLFWTITLLARKVMLKKGEKPAPTQAILILGAGLVGALGFIYTDTFWFSAVETIVFSPAMLCTSLVVWAIMKWDSVADEPGADRWLVFIAYIMGLSIGIHLLNLLTIPALTLVYYFRRWKRISTRNTLIALLIGVVLLAFVQFGIIQYTVKLAGYTDLFAVNSLGMPFNTGALIFLLALFSGLAYGIFYSIRKRKYALNVALICTVFIYFGYSSFTMIPIRAHAGTNLNNYHPDNAFKLTEYLSRIQYVAPPLLYGQYFDGKMIDQKEGPTLYRKGDKKYEVIGKRQDLVYDHNTILPRIFSNDPNDVSFYRQWLNLGKDQSPTFGDNLNYLFSWQIYQMYFRYFFWNFSGRYNDADGQTSTFGINGNWTTGWLDHHRQLPKSVLNSYTYTPLYALPLIIGLLGMFWHFKKNKQDALVILMLYFFMGIAIVLYVNQYNLQPRERDYSYVGSFYAFAIWVGLGVLAMADIMVRKLNQRTAALAAVGLCFIAFPVITASSEWKDHDRSTKMVAHDMAYNYLMSCPKNAILFNSGDNETYPLWYLQEAEGVRPDVRLVNLNLFPTDWNIRQMQQPINKAAALPITMSYDKYKDGVRDFIRYQDSKLGDSVELKEVFDFMMSEDPQAKLQYEDGTIENYLPTKNFMLTVDKKAVLQNGVVSPDQIGLLTDTMKWKFPGNYLNKGQLALMDILAHNNWKRPICFSALMNDEMLGLKPYMYKEGMVYRLLPLKEQQKDEEQGDQLNLQAMYKNMLEQYRYGNMKHAKYLDEQSRNLFYPMTLNNFISLAQHLDMNGQKSLAVKAIRKMDEVLPDLNPYIEITAQKYYLADTAYHLQEVNLANKYVKSTTAYLKDQLDYNYHLYQNDADTVNVREVQVGMWTLNQMTDLTKKYNQPVLYAQLDKELKDYEQKFSGILGKQ
ncbi:DUF2723 domain-containing protein [Mucilaginibacter sp. RS28]|uniref:DUF2723 domain-containing protein n=1 Tax=Mucilaginibacter straminoryzae TaxID=2932774 RepID=A0A9X1X157_9SPHI|nr:DUF2723 domain-containing protein [Mucilaginibacter straminoryzae]MCJ8209317.1 DUF2723 domain-containing protein [Mucilaginibacter straminoryzae]